MTGTQIYKSHVMMQRVFTVCTLLLLGESRESRQTHVESYLVLKIGCEE
jgi:hypothetical protein